MSASARQSSSATTFQASNRPDHQRPAAFGHCNRREGFQESVFVEAQSNMRDLIQEYEAIERMGIDDGDLEEEEDSSDA
jgi:hypothetical protein